MHFIADIEVGRLWLISFNLHYLHASKNQQWKSQIDSSFSDNNWYLSNKNTYGNQRYIFKRVFTYYLCVTTLSIISFFTIGTTHYHIAQFIDSIFYSIPLFLLLHTYYKCPKHTECNDLFLFHYEFRCAVIIFIVCMIVFLLIMVLNYFQITFWVSVISTLNASIPLVLPSLLSTLWIPIKIISQSVWGIQLGNRNSNSNISMMHVIQLHDNNTNKQQCIDTKLKNILLNEEKFESFVSWVYREFSGEIILSFCEFVQFKHCIMNEICVESVTQSYKLYDNIPKSSIIYGIEEQKENGNDEENFSPRSLDRITSISSDGDNVMEKYKIMAHLLYKKYIEYNTELEINISAAMKNKYREMDNNSWNMDIETLANVFDKPMNEMFAFLKQSFVRYDS